MKIVVLKFGGTSVGTVDRVKKVANIIVGYVKKKYKVIVVSSAMSGVTNDLVKKSKKISNNFISSEYDALVSSGEQMSCALIAGSYKKIIVIFFYFFDCVTTSFTTINTFFIY